MAHYPLARTGRRRSPAGSALSLLAFVAVALLAGGMGVLLQGDALDSGGWYEGLDKPAFTPPSAVFAPVWTTLYVLIGIAGWLLWRRRDRPGADVALALWAAQLVLNALWTGAFFGAHSPLLGLVDIVALLAVIVLLVARARRVDGRAALLLLPYLAWVGFATLLNATILAMN
jgi:tryptophan-rich sensory protein